MSDRLSDRAHRFRRSWVCTGLRLRLAAALTVTALAVAGCSSGDSAGSASGPRPVTVVKPTAETPFDRTFDWNPIDGATDYRVVVFTDDGERSFEVHDLRTTSVALAKTVTLPAGSYFWQVTALRDGQAVGESARIPFTIK
jgi:hypothetical protein